MKKLLVKFLHSIAYSFGLRQILLLSGIALLAACSGKSNSKDSKSSHSDSINVKCYDPKPIPDSSHSDTVNASEKLSV